MLKNLTSCYSELSFLRAHCSKILSFFNVFNSLSLDSHSHSRSLSSLFFKLSFSWVWWGCWWLQVEVCLMTASGLWVGRSMGSWIIFLLWFAWWVSVVFFNGDVSQWQWVVRLLDGSRWCCGWLCCRLCWWVEVVGCGFVVVRLLGNGGRLGGWYAVGWGRERMRGKSKVVLWMVLWVEAGGWLCRWVVSWLVLWVVSMVEVVGCVGLWWLGWWE